MKSKYLAAALLGTALLTGATFAERHHRSLER